MVYINTTGKHNEVWLDKPYATITVECPDCPSTEDAYNSGWTDGSEDGYHKGYQSGRTDGYDDGWGPGYDSGYTDAWQPAYDSGYTDGLEACSGETIHNQFKYCNIGTGRTDNLKLKFTGNCYTFEDNPQVNITYDSGYTGLERVGIFMYFYPTEAIQQGFNSGYTSGYTDGLNACSGGSCEGVWEDGYDSGFTDGVNSVECSGYTQEDLDAAFASGYTAGLRDCSGYTPESGETGTSGYVMAIYDVQTTSAPTKILSATSSFSQAKLEDGTIIPLDTGYTFSRTGRQKVFYTLTGHTIDENTFYNCFLLVEIHFPETGLTKIDNYSFILTSLSTVVIPDTVTSIGERAFWRCNSLRSVSIGTGCRSLGYGCFENTPNMQSINLGAVQTIGGSCFQGCGIQSFVFPPTVVSFGPSAITNNTITQLTFLGSTPARIDKQNSIGSIYTDTYPIYVPAAAVQTYKETWTGHASRIQAIP